jgi:hypothetical protein
VKAIYIANLQLALVQPCVYFELSEYAYFGNMGKTSCSNLTFYGNKAYENLGQTGG